MFLVRVEMEDMDTGEIVAETVVGKFETDDEAYEAYDELVDAPEVYEGDEDEETEEL